MDEFLHGYTELLTDPAHLAYEITLIIMIDVLLVGFAWPFIKRGIRRHDKTHHPVPAPPIDEMPEWLQQQCAWTKHTNAFCPYPIGHDGLCDWQEVDDD